MVFPTFHLPNDANDSLFADYHHSWHLVKTENMVGLRYSEGCYHVLKFKQRYLHGEATYTIYQSECFGDWHVSLTQWSLMSWMQVVIKICDRTLAMKCQQYVGDILPTFLSCILWFKYHAIYIFIHIYIVCILMIIYNIIPIFTTYIYICYVRLYFLITSKLDFQLMICLLVPGGGGISEGSAEKLSLGTRDLSVDLLGMTVFAVFWAMPVWSMFIHKCLWYFNIVWHHLRKMMPPNLEFYNRTDSVNIFRISSTSNQRAESPYVRWSYSWSRHLGGFVKPMNQLAIWRKKTGNLEVSNMKRAELVMFHSKT